MVQPRPAGSRRSACTWLLVAAALAASGCALRPPRGDGDPRGGAHWSGRLALQVEDAQAQSFSATFDLRGNAERGELSLFTPMGSTVARLEWAPGAATLHADHGPRDFDSLDALVRHVTGTALPMPALFSWLDGQPADVPGWRADLSQSDDGRLTAYREDPTPPAVLRVVLDR